MQQKTLNLHSSHSQGATVEEVMSLTSSLIVEKAGSYLYLHSPATLFSTPR